MPQRKLQKAAADLDPERNDITGSLGRDRSALKSRRPGGCIFVYSDELVVGVVGSLVGVEIAFGSCKVVGAHSQILKAGYHPSAVEGTR